MATRQSASKSAKRTASSAAGKPARGTTTSPAKPARGAGSPAAAGKPGRGAANSAADKPARGTPNAPAGKLAKGAPAAQPTQGAGTSPARRALTAPGAAWRAAVRWGGGGGAFTTLIVSLLGLADSTYLTIEHFTQSTTLACPENATFNCVKVTTSPESHVFGIPVAVLGLTFFLFMVAVNSPWGWRAPWPALHWLRLGSVVVGIVFVLYLIWAELFRINSICLYCTGVHVLTFILFGLIVGRAAFSGVRAIPDRD